MELISRSPNKENILKRVLDSSVASENSEIKNKQWFETNSMWNIKIK